MLRRILTFVIAIILTVTGLILMETILPHISFLIGYDVHSRGVLGYSYIHWLFALLGVLFFGWVGWVITPFIIKFILKYSEIMASVLAKAPSGDIIVTLIGVVVGLILANLLGAPFSHLPIIGQYLPIVLSIVFALVGAKVALRKSKDILGMFNHRRIQETFHAPSGKAETGEETDPSAFIPFGSDAVPAERGSLNKLLDTSVIIDGRIADILKTGFLEGNLIVPNFVLEELQRLSDSSDAMKRAKGRRGLDLIRTLQQENDQIVVVNDLQYEAIPEVDGKLVAMANDTGSVIVTNDFNLNKVASIQGIQVLNINDLANSVKPVVLPGEEMSAYLLREGRETGRQWRICRMER